MGGALLGSNAKERQDPRAHAESRCTGHPASRTRWQDLARPALMSGARVGAIGQERNR